MPKVPTTPFRDKVVNLQVLPSEEADPALALLCPIRALRIHVDHAESFRTSELLFSSVPHKANPVEFLRYPRQLDVAERPAPGLTLIKLPVG